MSWFNRATPKSWFNHATPTTRSNRLTRRLFAAGLLSLAAGCGFVPLYHAGGTGTALSGQVLITTPETIEGYHLRASLLTRLGPGESGAYRLNSSFEIAERTAAIGNDGAVIRYTLTGTANWRFLGRTGAQISSGTASNFVSYSVSGTTVATRTARDDATRRLAQLLADLIAAQLLALPPDLVTGAL
ncbi:MAG: hypothetical protein JKX69_12575 [Rhodobacteraceae bacterium]|nr:hypothetical protein [Paracoccaceae bacterium]